MGKLFTGIDSWLNTEPNLPKELQEALRHNGLTEIAGEKHNPTIIGWLKELGIFGWIKTDESPWCGVFKGICALRSGWLKLPAPQVAAAIWWATWGRKVEIKDVCVGDTLIKSRVGGNHVTYCIGENDKYFRTYGGNQSNMVCPGWMLKSEVTHARRAIWNSSQPLGVKKHYYANLDGTPAKLSEA